MGWGKIKYKTEKFDVNNEELLWEKFMCFVRMFIPYEKELQQLTLPQKYPVIAFIYESEVLGDGHIQFMDLYQHYIKIEDLIKAFGILGGSIEYTEILKKLPANLPENWDNSEVDIEKCAELYESFDEKFYDIANEDIDNKILNYVKLHLMEFFEY